ncbi:MAG: 2-C-methyl-D-erythritol 2,4-cyclodiphosphate synthase [Candidatus Omnitrophota bacterium]
MRIGIGYDIHKLVEKRKLIIGGVRIPHTKGLLGHSDADVLIHAICDALLGAAACGDIGEHFPNTDSRYKGISSLKILKETLSIISSKRYTIHNIDAVIIAEEPKMLPFKNKMKENIAKTLSIDLDNINIKATTEEGTRNSQAIAAYAVVLLK